jgi:hypothetical protein
LVVAVDVVNDWEVVAVVEEAGIIESCRMKFISRGKLRIKK